MVNEYYALRKSNCHNDLCLIVQSRPGGFVTKNCLTCGIPSTLPFDELPDINCPKCGDSMSKSIGYDKNYQYTCNKCNKSIPLWTMVPYWNEYFEEHGIGLESDQSL